MQPDFAASFGLSLSLAIHTVVWVSHVFLRPSSIIFWKIASACLGFPMKLSSLKKMYLSGRFFMSCITESTLNCMTFLSYIPGIVQKLQSYGQPLDVSIV